MFEETRGNILDWYRQVVPVTESGRICWAFIVPFTELGTEENTVKFKIRFLLSGNLKLGEWEKQLHLKNSTINSPLAFPNAALSWFCDCLSEAL